MTGAPSQYYPPPQPPYYSQFPQHGFPTPTPYYGGVYGGYGTPYPHMVSTSPSMAPPPASPYPYAMHPPASPSHGVSFVWNQQSTQPNDGKSRGSSLGKRPAHANTYSDADEYSADSDEPISKKTLKARARRRTASSQARRKAQNIKHRTAQREGRPTRSYDPECGACLDNHAHSGHRPMRACVKEARRRQAAAQPAQFRETKKPHDHNLRTRSPRPPSPPKRKTRSDAARSRDHPINLHFIQRCDLNPPPAITIGDPNTGGVSPMGYLAHNLMSSGFQLVTAQWSTKAKEALALLYSASIRDVAAGRGGSVHVKGQSVRLVYTDPKVRDDFADIFKHPQVPDRSPSDDAACYVPLDGNEEVHAAWDILGTEVQDRLNISVPPVEFETVVTPPETPPGRGHLDTIGSCVSVVIKLAPMGTDGKWHPDFSGTSNGTDAWVYETDYGATPDEMAANLYKAIKTVDRVSIGMTPDDILVLDGNHWHAAPGNPRQLDPTDPLKGTRAIAFMSFETPRKYFSDSCVIFDDEFIDAYEYHHPDHVIVSVK
jgi:hypothetical protein